MKRIFAGLLLGLLIFTGCAPAKLESTPPTSFETATSVPPTLTPSRTPIPPTQTVTPLPTIPTFTPTLDASTIVTVTPAAKAECPKENSATREFATPDSNGFYEIIGPEDVLTYLNSGGTLAQLEKGPPFSGEIKDVTGDGVNEVIFSGMVRHSILGCKGGKYQNLFNSEEGEFGVSLEGTPDLNKNGIPELIFYSFSHYGDANIYIVGWDGDEFRSLINVGTDSYTGAAIDSIFANTYHKLADTNGDGLKEILVVYDVNEFCGGLGNPCDGTPARKQTTTLAWNGQNYVVQAQENGAPKYRFQAIQDGDLQARYGYYAEALSFYQAAIFNDRLEWWSPEREEFERRTYWAQYDPTPTVYPTAIFDNTEYPRLAAYAYYRLMLLHLVQGNISDAEDAYNTLQETFGDDPNGKPYVEMATMFWDAYQSTHQMYDDCAA
ncbi:MAG: hypothetical protein WCC12_21350, partial [Anaerolineales bacterium]